MPPRVRLLAFIMEALGSFDHGLSSGWRDSNQTFDSVTVDVIEIVNDARERRT